MFVCLEFDCFEFVCVEYVWVEFVCVEFVCSGFLYVRIVCVPLLIFIACLQFNKQIDNVRLKTNQKILVTKPR